jgi:hypothetical protein
MRTRFLLATACFVAACVGACGGSDNGLFAGAACAQGPTVACTCAGGEPGTQSCYADQSGYAPCVCTDGGVGDGAAGGGGDASSEAGKDAAFDGAAGKDAQGAGGSGGSSGTGGMAGKGGAGGTSGAGGSGGSTGEAIATLGDPCSKPGELACAGHAQKLMLVCDGSKWASNGVCSGMQICDTRPGLTAGSCQDPVPLCVGHQPGEGVCDGANRIVCGPDLLTSTSVMCASEALCKLGSGDQCGVCMDGQFQCDGANLEKCAPDHLAWGFQAACASAQLCDAAGAKCNPAVCSPNQHHCSADALEKCNAGLTGFTFVQACQPGLCDAAGKQCDLCKPGALGCANTTTIATCAADGQSQTTQPCPSGTPYCVGAGQCGTCSQTSLPATQSPVDMFFMLDVSGSMTGTNMAILQPGVTGYTNGASSAGTWASGNQFPIEINTVTSCVPSDYSKSVVPWSALPSTAFSQWVSALVVLGLTPSVPALQGAVSACKTRKLSQPGRTCMVIFVTDGEPTECDPNGQAAMTTLGAIAADAWANGIAVHGIAFPNMTSVGTSLLNYIAQQGGTGAPTTVYSASQLTTLLQTIQGSAVSCTFAKPPGTLDTVQLTPTNGPAVILPRVLDASQCAGDAYYYDNNTTPTQIVMCPTTCQKLKADPSAKLDVKACS